MRWVIALLLLLVPACSKKKPEPKIEPSAPVVAKEAPEEIAAKPEPAAPPPSAKAKLQISLRSTPGGAEAQVDGKPAGKTPVTVPVDDDGKEHEFVFLLPGYGMERYKTSPLKNGVIHARMRPVPADAGP
jgi:hypothetical protein